MILKHKLFKCNENINQYLLHEYKNNTTGENILNLVGTVVVLIWLCNEHL